jgi:hypothetical protein
MGPALVCIGPTSLGRRKKKKNKHWNHTGRRKEKGVEDTCFIEERNSKSKWL